jgi:hypothetical protein
LESLVDTVGCSPARLVLVYFPQSPKRVFWTRALDPAFAHVEIWREIGEGYFVALRPDHEFIDVDVIEGPPSGIYQYVTARRRLGVPLCPIGLKTCVSVAKAALGLRAPWIITPKQLYDYVSVREGIV